MIISPLAGKPAPKEMLVDLSQLEFEIPVFDPPHESWRRCIDTYLDPPDDICGWASARSLQGSTCRVEPRSLVLLLAKAKDRP
jgi:glycogen operon protein